MIASHFLSAFIGHGRAGPQGHRENPQWAPQNTLQNGPFESQNFTITYTFYKKQAKWALYLRFSWGLLLPPARLCDWLLSIISCLQTASGFLSLLPGY